MAASKDQSSSPYASAPARGDEPGGVELREMLRRGDVTFGLWCAIPSSFSVELVCGLDFDWVCVDTQHGLVGYSDMVAMLQAAYAHRMPALVRVSGNRPELDLAGLDAGATGASWSPW